MVVAVKVYKKITPNGKMTVYLGKRDFIDHVDFCDPVDGVVVLDEDYLRGRKVFGQVSKDLGSENVPKSRLDTSKFHEFENKKT